MGPTPCNVPCVDAACRPPTLVLDIIHAVEYLWAAANGLLGERHPDRTDWVRVRLERLLDGQVAAVISDLEVLAEATGTTFMAKQPHSGPRPATPATIGGMRPFMRYDAYLARLAGRLAPGRWKAPVVTW